MDSLRQFAQYLRDASAILAFTGAGISTRSGIPDYRGPQGTWTQRQPVDYASFMRSEAAREDYWDYKLEWWEGYRNLEPNAAHRALVQLERAGKLCMLVTQNVDGLHSLAGTAREKLVEIHGTNSLIECQSCRALSEPGPHFESFKATRKAPRCSCGGYLKPATISFGQSLRVEDLERASAAADACDLVVALGSTLSVYPAAGIPLAAAAHGARYVIVNQGPTDHDGLPDVTQRIEGDVTEVFPSAVEQALQPTQGG